MKDMKKALLVAFTLIAAATMSACGGGSSTSSATPTPTPGAAVSQGVVTAKGSVFVNGIEFFPATDAVITIDGITKTEADLKVGMVVKVRGTSDDGTKIGTAKKIEARDALEGKIEAIDPVTKTITVMGQIVQIEDNLTRLNDVDALKTFTDATTAPVGTPAALVVGDTVEVHGFADDAGNLRATRVAKKQIGEIVDFEMKGIVTVVGATSFSLSTPGRAGVLTVNFAAPLTAPALNSMVEVKTLVVPAVGATTITASSIRIEDALGAENEKVEVEGIVAANGTLASFVINGQKVTTNAATVFEGGLKADFAPGVKIEAQGPLNAGTIVATKIIFRSNIKIEAVATGVTATGLTLLGKQVVINKFTRMDAGIVDGNQVEVRANLDRNGNLVATRVVKRSSVDNKAFLQGPVTAFDAAAGTMTILGVNITTTGTAFRISTDATELPSTKDVFFAKVKANVTVVKVRWDAFTATTVAVKEVEIELGK